MVQGKMHYSMIFFLALSTSIAMEPTVEISPGVNMPRINLGTCCGSESTNSFPIWYAHGGRGVDTALDYGMFHTTLLTRFQHNDDPLTPQM